MHPSVSFRARVNVRYGNFRTSSRRKTVAEASAANVRVVLKRTTLDEGPAAPPESNEYMPIPETLKAIPPPPESVLAVYEVPTGTTIADAGRALEAQLHDALQDTGAVLVRNLPVSSTADVAEMAASAKQADACRPSSAWTDMPYVPFGAPRDEKDGILIWNNSYLLGVRYGDYVEKMQTHGPSLIPAHLHSLTMVGERKATNIPPEFVLKCHNESSYNPQVPRRIGLMCLEAAANGGESLITRNEDLTAAGPLELLDFVREHGGLEFKRVYHDKHTASPEGSFAMSWQDRCNLGDDDTREAAETYWKAHGFSESNISWAEDGSLVISNVTTGFTPPTGSTVGAPFPGGYAAYSGSAEVATSLGIPTSNLDSNAAGRDWFNIITNLPPGHLKTADGSALPLELVKMHDEEAWHKNYAVKLRAGDLLMLDNLRVQHGRLPFSNGEGAQRKMATLLYE